MGVGEIHPASRAREERTKPLPPVIGRTRRYSRRLFRCFGHTSQKALKAPENFSPSGGLRSLAPR